MPGTSFLERIGLTHPVIQGPMSGGFTPPELVAAVSNAGGLGSFGAAYLAPGQIRADIAKIRALTKKPFNVNLFAVNNQPPRADTAPMLEIMAEMHGHLNIPPPAAPEFTPHPFPAQIEAVLAEKPEIFSFTFGIPDEKTIARLKSAGIYLLGTATTVEEARLLEKSGIDAVVVQGEEAGGHRGSFAGDFEKSMVPMMDLLRETVKAVSIPVIASGGIMNGRDIAAVLEAGAVAAQLGTAFLACPEAGTAEAHKKALLDVREDTTVITRAFSGRPARALPNGFIRRLEGHENIILPFPVQNNLTRPMRAAAAKQGDKDYLSLWAGKKAMHVRRIPAAELVRTMVDEMNAARS